MRTGVLLPAEFLEQPWFTAFALAVAFNTIIYLGLTFSKLVPWPAQVHPSRIRDILPEPIAKDGSMPDARRQTQRQSEDPVEALRLDAVRSSIPRALALGGGLVILVVIVNSIVGGMRLDWPRVATLAFGLAMLVLSQVLYRQTVRPRAMVWIWTFMCTVLATMLCWYGVRLDSEVVLTYAVMVVILSSPIALSWPAAIAGGIIQVAVICVAGYLIESINTALWAVAAISGLIASYVLLQVRLNNVDNMSFAQLQANRLATTDPLTGCFARTGMLTIASTLTATAQRTNQELYVVLCDIDTMERTNTDYGFAYGDTVIEATARALRACLPEGDVIARWDGDAFVALGIGDHPEPASLATAIDAALATGGVALGKVPVRVHVGLASARPGEATFEHLVDDATRNLRRPSP